MVGHQKTMDGQPSKNKDGQPSEKNGWLAIRKKQMDSHLETMDGQPSKNNGWPAIHKQRMASHLQTTYGQPSANNVWTAICKQWMASHLQTMDGQPSINNGWPAICKQRMDSHLLLDCLLIKIHFISNHKTFFFFLIYRCCNNIVKDAMQKKMDNQEDNADHEYKDLQSLKSESDEWIKTAILLLHELTGEMIEFRPASSSVKVSEGKAGKDPSFHDQEKLSVPDVSIRQVSFRI
jgi:hypothetical protein